MNSRPRVLLISLDPIGERMAGLAIRYVELARVLSAHAQVTIAAAGGERPAGLAAEFISFNPHRPAAIRAAIARADTIITPPQWPLITRWMQKSRARLIYDLYDPESLETLELFARSPPWHRRLMVDLTIDRLRDSLAIGTNFICASERQRDLWLGAMLATRSIEPSRYDADPSLRDLLDVVPFGSTSQLPVHNSARPGLHDHFPALGPDHEIVLWNGGLWRWLDAPTAIRAVALLHERRPAVRLVFMGSSDAPAAVAAAEEARAVANGLTEGLVLFNDTWVAYDERVNWLLDADCAISTHRDHLETRFAFRTRLLDCFWSGLPVVCTCGDDLATRVERDDLGASVQPGDVEGTADAIERVLEHGRASYAERLAAANTDLQWSRVAEPLIDWIANPDAQAGGRSTRLRARTTGHQLRAAAYSGGRHVLARRSSG